MWVLAPPESGHIQVLVEASSQDGKVGGTMWDYVTLCSFFPFHLLCITLYHSYYYQNYQSKSSTGEYISNVPANLNPSNLTLLCAQDISMFYQMCVLIYFTGDIDKNSPKTWVSFGEELSNILQQVEDLLVWHFRYWLLDLVLAWFKQVNAEI